MTTRPCARSSGRLLFSRRRGEKIGEGAVRRRKGRMMFGKLMLGRHNVLLMDEPTNHMDMESIESLNIALDKYTGTLIFVSHDREFVSSLATRIIEMKPDGIIDFQGSYETTCKAKGSYPSVLHPVPAIPAPSRKKKSFACLPADPLLRQVFGILPGEQATG